MAEIITWLTHCCHIDLLIWSLLFDFVLLHCWSLPYLFSYSAMYNIWLSYAKVKCAHDVLIYKAYTLEGLTVDCSAALLFTWLNVTVSGSDSLGNCGRLSQPSWLLVCTIIIVILIMWKQVRDKATIHCVSKKVPTCKLSVTLSNLNRFAKFLRCWKAYEICYKTHMYTTQLSLGMLLQYLAKLKIQISADIQPICKKMQA